MSNIVCIIMAFVGMCFGFYMLGYDRGRKDIAKQVDLWTQTKPRERKRWPSFKNMVDFSKPLDPITPQDQRLEMELESKVSGRDDIDG